MTTKTKERKLQISSPKDLQRMAEARIGKSGKTPKKTPEERKAVKNAISAIEDVSQQLLSLMDLGKAFDCNNAEYLTGYTLADAVGAISREIIATLEKGGLLPERGEESEAQQHAREADYILTDLAKITSELSHDSDDWTGAMETAVGRMVYTMAFAAAREIERAEEIIGGNRRMGFLDRDFSLTP